jgi:4-hydroxymandelate oxidase
MIPFDGQLATIADYEFYAKQVTPPALFEFYYGEHGDPNWSAETSNRAGYHALKLRPRVLIDVSQRNLATTFLGIDISLPVVVGPTGILGDHDPQGEVPTVKAAGAAGTIAVLSGVSTTPSDEIADAATGPWFQQVWLHDDRGLTEWQVRRAVELGAAAIVLTVSNSGETWHTRTPRFPGAAAKLPPAPATNLKHYDAPVIPTLYEMTDTMSRSTTWKDVEWLRTLTPTPLLVKGIQTAEDAELCVEHGIDALVISNHGGRFLQGCRGTIEALPEIVEAVGGRIEIGLDGGIRQGHDILKALALGANVVWIGRAARWGATVGGEEGVRGVLEILSKELDGAMGLCGLSDVNDIPSSLVTRAATPTMES